MEEDKPLVVVGKEHGPSYGTCEENTRGAPDTAICVAAKPSIFILLYLSSFLTAFGDRMWEFAVPIILTKIFTDSLLPASVFPFSTQLACIVFGTLVGSGIDGTDRRLVMIVSLITQNVGMAVCSVLLYFIMAYEAQTPPFEDMGFVGLFILFNICGSIAALASMAESIAVGRDWVVVLANKDSEILADANAVLTRISLICKMGAPVIFAVILYFTDTFAILVFVCCWNLFSLLPEVLSLDHIYRKIPQLQTKIQSETGSLLAVCTGFMDYIQSKNTFLPSFAYVFLYMTVLSPGALMTAYLLTQGINELYISAYQAVSAIVGVFATFGTPTLIRLTGLGWAGFYSLWFQQACLLLSLVAFFMPQLPSLLEEGWASAYTATWAFLALLAISRLGLWSYDLVERQIMQEYVPEEKRGAINAVEFSLMNFFSLGSYLMGIVAPDPEHFGWLAITSFIFVTAAALLYSSWIGTRNK